jgi:Sortase domain
MFSAAALLGLALVLGSGYELVGRKPTPRDFGAGYQSKSVASSAAPDSTARAPSSPHKSTARAPSSAPKSTARAAPSSPKPAVPVMGAGPPGWLVLPTLGVRAHIRNVVTTDGVLGVPDNPAEVGWWTGSVPAGSSTGSTVIDGHVDSAVTGTGALFHLTDLAAGDPISVTTATGLVVRYRVTGRRVYVKHQGLPADLFATSGPPRLVLITCGGPFDSTTRNYQDNIVIFATPAA